MGLEVDDFYTPETLRYYLEQIDELRRHMLCVDDAGADAESEQFFLLALAALDSAERYMHLAVYRQSKALAQSGRG